MSDKKKLKVRLLDKEYSLLVDDEAVASELVDYVNKSMKEIQEEAGDQPHQTIAVIAALNIAYDYFIEKNKNKEFLIQANERIKKMKQLFARPEINEPSI